MFLKALPIIKGMVAEIVYPVANESPTMFLAPVSNLLRRAAGFKLKISSGRIAPSS